MRRSSSSCSFYIPCSSIPCRCVTSIPHPSPAAARAVRAGAGFTALQTQQHYVLKLLHHLDYSRFCLLIIQFITSVTEINCQQKQASISCALQPILTTWDWLSDPPKEKYPLLFPKLIPFLWAIFWSFETISERPVAGFNCFLNGLILLD